MGRKELEALIAVLQQQLAKQQDGVVVGTWNIVYSRDHDAFLFEKCELGAPTAKSARVLSPSTARSSTAAARCSASSRVPQSRPQAHSKSRCCALANPPEIHTRNRRSARCRPPLRLLTSDLRHPCRRFPALRRRRYNAA